MPVAIALYQPDIAQNTGTIARLCACMGCDLHIIEPAGFAVTDKAFRRAGMDYIDELTLHRHMNYQAFTATADTSNNRIILLTTKASAPHTDFKFQDGDILLFGRESAGVPEELHDSIEHRIIIPMQKQARSLNVAISAAMVLNEALRQTTGFPTP